MWLCGFTLNFMTLLGLSLAIGVLIDDAIVVRENIVRHMERGEDRVTAARNGTAEIGLAVTATTFSIVAVFVPVAFMGGGAGEWFRPFARHRGGLGAGEPVHLLHARPDAVGLLGRSAGLCAQRERRGLGKVLQRFNAWFDHQADRYGSVIAWALHHRMWMAVIAVLSLVGALALQVTFGGSEFLPKSDDGMIAIEVRTPSSASLEYAALQGREGRGARAHDSRNQGHQQPRQRRRRPRLRRPRARAERKRVRRRDRRATCARSSSSWSAPNTSCSTT